MWIMSAGGKTPPAEFRKLPGGIYNTSYIRQYARAIDYDESAILAVYNREMSREPSAKEKDGGKKLYGGFRAASTLLGS